MNYLTETYPNCQACQKAALECALRSAKSGKRPVIIVPSYDQQMAFQQFLAQEGHGFGIQVATLRNWVADLWGLFGDGSSLVSNSTRSITLYQLLSENAVLQDSPGMLDLLCECASVALPYAKKNASLSKGEAEAVEILLQYQQHLRDHSLIEYSETLIRLAHADYLHSFSPVILGMREDQLSQAEEEFLNACSAMIVINSQSTPCQANQNIELEQAQSLLYRRSIAESPVKQTGAVRFFLAAGPSASNKSILNAIFHALENGCKTVLVADPDPCALFDFCLNPLTKQKISSKLSGSKLIGSTHMGAALSLLGSLTQNASQSPEQAQPLLAADYAINPFSGIGKTSAFRIAKMHRGNRLTDQDSILTDLASSSDDILSGLINRIEDHAFEDAISLLKEFLIARYSQNHAYLSEQMSVLETFEELCLEESNLTFASIASIASRMSVGISVETGADHQVLFTTQSQAASFDAGSYDCVIISNLNADKVSAQIKESALGTLLEKIEAQSKLNPLAQTRSQFYGSFESARNMVILQRCLNNEKGDPAQAAIVFEELVDCYRPSITQDIGMNKVLGIPESMMPYVSQLGEQDILGNAGVQNRQTQQFQTLLNGEIAEESRNMVVLPQRYSDGFFEGLDVSPSQIESYLECPYSWFAKRRLRLEGLDEGFGPTERGTFVHEVLRKFYQSFQSQVQPKVTIDTIPIATQILSDVFYQVSEEQPFERRGNRYVPRTAWEEKERQSVLPKLIRYLEMEARLLPGFRPFEFEWQFAKARPFPYAECNLRGCIDRIDIDDRGNAVVIDYKSSLSNDYRLFDSKDKNPPDTFQLPKKMQTLMYAKVVRETLGLQVVGALYVNPLKQEVLGAYDAHFLGPEDIPFAKAVDSTNCQVPYQFAQSMDELINICEEHVQTRLEGLAKGLIEPNPINEQACQLCPVNICSKRLAPRRQ